MSNSFPPIQAVLFDLDGTLLDTHKDLGHALNQTLELHGRPQLPMHIIKAQVSNGANALIRLGFGGEPTADQQPLLRQQLLDFYLADIAVHTELFEGISELLNQLCINRIKWGIVTNKPALYTRKLVESLQFEYPPAVLVSPDDVGVGKPDPRPLLHACQQLGIKSPEAVYIGDHKRDIEAADNAGMQSIAVGYGFIGEDDDHRNWRAQFCAAHASDLWPIIQTLI